MIEFNDVSKIYDNGVVALNNISVRIEKGEFVFLIGPSGAGKSTFLKTIFREEVPTSGEVFIDGRNITSLSRYEVPYLRRNIGVVFQDFKLLEIRTQPETVEVRGAERQVRQMTQARVSVQSDFEDPPASWSEDIPIKLAEGVEANPGQVKVTLRFGPEVKTAWVRVPVRVEAEGGVKAQTGQKHVRVQVEGPVPLLREAEAGRDIQGLTAVAKVSAGLKAGRHSLRYELSAPQGFRVLSRQTDTVDVVVQK